MPWTYFTSPLLPGETISRDQRNELYDALTERILVVAETDDFIDPQMTDVRISEILTARLKATFLGSSSTLVMSSWLIAIHGRFIKQVDPVPESYESGVYGDEYFDDVAAAVGITRFQLDHLWGLDESGPGIISSATYWNSIRAGILLLRYAIRFTSLIETTGKSATSGFSPNWTLVLANYLAAPETDQGFLQEVELTSSNASIIKGARVITRRIEVPNISQFSMGYRAWIPSVWAGTVRNTNDTLVIEFNSSTFFEPLPFVDPNSLTPVDSNAFLTFTDVGSGLTNVGNVDFSVKLEGYDDPSPYETVSGGVIRSNAFQFYLSVFDPTYSYT